MQAEQTNNNTFALSVWLLAAMFALPFTIGYHITPMPSFYNEVFAFMLGLLAMYPLLQSRAWLSLSWPHASILFLGLIPIVIYQCAIDLIPTRSQALMYSCYFVWSALLMVLGAYHQKQRKIAQVINTLAKGIVLAAWFNVGYVGLQLLQKTGIYSPSVMLAVPFGAISQANHFANFMAIAIVSLIYLKFTQVTEITQKNAQPLLNKAHFSLGLFAFTLSLTLSGSRSGWLYLLAMGLIAIWFAFKQKQSSVKPTATSLIKLSLMLLPLFLVMQFLVAELAQGYVLTAVQRLDELGDPQVTGGLKLRLHMWQQSLQIFMQHPWTGIGLGQTRWFTFSTLDPNLQNGFKGAYENPHNLVMQLLSEVGLIGTLIVLTPLVIWLKSFIKKPASINEWWLLSVFAVLGIHSLLEYPMSYAYFLGFTAYLIGLTQKREWHLIAWLNKPLKYSTVTLISLGFLICIHTFHSYSKLDYWIKMLTRKQFTAQSMDSYYQTISWLNQKSLLAAYSYPMFLLAIEYLPIENAGKQAVNEASLRVLPMPKSAYLQVVYLLQQNKEQQALHAMKLAIQSFPEDYKERLKSVPPALLTRYQQLYQQAKQSLESH